MPSMMAVSESARRTTSMRKPGVELAGAVASSAEAPVSTARAACSGLPAPCYLLRALCRHGGPGPDAGRDRRAGWFFSPCCRAKINSTLSRQEAAKAKGDGPVALSRKTRLPSTPTMTAAAKGRAGIAISKWEMYCSMYWLRPWGGRSLFRRPIPAARPPGADAASLRGSSPLSGGSGASSKGGWFASRRSCHMAMSRWPCARRA